MEKRNSNWSKESPIIFPTKSLLLVFGASPSDLEIISFAKEFRFFRIQVCFSKSALQLVFGLIPLLRFNKSVLGFSDLQGESSYSKPSRGLS